MNSSVFCFRFSLIYMLTDINISSVFFETESVKRIERNPSRQSLISYSSRAHSRRNRGDIAIKVHSSFLLQGRTIKDVFPGQCSRRAAFSRFSRSQHAVRVGKECHITVYCCRPTKRGLWVIRRNEVPAFPRK